MHLPSKQLIYRLTALPLATLLLCACTTTAPPSSSEALSSPSRSESTPPSTPTSETAPVPEPEPEPGPTYEAQAYFPLPPDITERITGISWVEGSPVPLEDLAYLVLPYTDFAGEPQLGEMVVHHTLAEEVAEIFTELYEAEWPIAQMVLIDDYGADDLASMAANNTSAFCARQILGTDRWSVHSYGAAIDIDPVQNPYITTSAVYPEAASQYLDRQAPTPGMITPGDACHTAFTSRGWVWGGDWPSPDYQHFEKNIEP